MFQAGLMGFMIGKFKSVWFLTIIYLGLCLGIQIWLVVKKHFYYISYNNNF